MNFNLKIWGQKNRQADGGFFNYKLKNISPDMSFLEMFDMLNRNLILKGVDPVAFDHDCLEGICGACSMYINGRPHGPDKLTTTCQLHMRSFKDGSKITVEPWRAAAFPIIKDLVVYRSAFDRIITAGGYISINTGSAPDANSIPVPKTDAEAAFNNASCIGCGACVAVCKNSSASLFVSAKISHLALLPQGHPERLTRVKNMVAKMDDEGFGSCSWTGACEAVCPKGITLACISRMHREFIIAHLRD